MMNIKIANLLANNIKNKKIVAEMIMNIGIKSEDITNRLIELCLSTDDKFVTKEVLLNHIDKIKPLCMKYMSNIINVDNIKIIYVDNIAGEIVITFKAQIEAWFKDKKSADRGDYWCANVEEDDEHKIKGTYANEISTSISFKDIDIDLD